MSGTALLALATSSFVGTHLLLSHPLRAPLVARLGERAFLGVYSLVAFLTLGWMIHAAVNTPGQAPLWIAPIGAWHVANLVMLLAAVLLAGSLIGNPAMVDPTGRPNIPAEASGVLAITRHPMMWAFILWAIVHGTLWSTPRSLILAGGIGLLSLAGALGQDGKKARILGQPWRDWQARTSFIPFAALLRGRARWGAAMPGAVALVGGLVFWALATFLHPMAGGPVVGPWMWTGRAG